MDRIYDPLSLFFDLGKSFSGCKVIKMSATEIKHYPCSSCGADLLFEPKDGLLTCPYCGHKEAIPESTEQVEEQSFEQHLNLRPEQMTALATNALEVQCQSCGAKSIFMPPEAVSYTHL